MTVVGRQWRGVVVFLLLAFALAWAAQIGLAILLVGRRGGLPPRPSARGEPAQVPSHSHS